jgi:alkylated DNA repair dioxygenase AlkB
VNASVDAGEATTEWLNDEPVVDRLQLDDTSWVDVVRGLVPRAEEVHHDLEAHAKWEQGRVFRYERWIDEPRLTSWTAGTATHPALREVQAWISRRYEVTFDGVALALYRDGRDSVAWHRDREMRWLDDTTIGVFSLGAQRQFLVKPLGSGRYADDDVSGALDFHPAGGDLLVMGGRCQADYLHAVPKTRGASRSRISAQWRYTSRRGRPDTNPSYYAPRHFSR